MPHCQALKAPDWDSDEGRGVPLGGGVGSQGVPATLERKFSVDRQTKEKTEIWIFMWHLCEPECGPEDTNLCPVTFCQAQLPDQQHQLDFGIC